MLAQNFKLPTELGLNEKQFGALVSTLRMLEREEIPADLFNMTSIKPNKECGMPGCILGWASTFERSWFVVDQTHLQRQVMEDLFCMGSRRSLTDKRADSITREQAAFALRAYLGGAEYPWKNVV